MAHLKGFGLENFRVFKEYTWFDFAPITILVGPNNSGKSSLIKALLLLKQNLYWLDQLEFGGQDHNLMSFKRIIHIKPGEKEPHSETISFIIPTGYSSEERLILNYRYLSTQKTGVLVGIDRTDSNGTSVLSENQKIITKHYITSEAAKSYINQITEPIRYLIYLPATKGNDLLGKLGKDSHDSYATSLQFFKTWAKQFGFDQIDIKVDERTNDFYVTVDGRALGDLGTGINQIVSLLLSTVNAVDSSQESKDEIEKYGGQGIILEEPEVNLHPKFQSMLADMMTDAKIIFKHQFIIETHSEYMIRKFQYLVAKGELKPEDIVIHYFHDPNNIPAGENQVKKITILEDGSLSDDFGPGFYDEAANLAMSLFDLRKNRHN